MPESMEPVADVEAALDDDGRLKRSALLRVEGVVYCLTHTDVHEDTLDPYGEGSKTCFEGMYAERTKAMVHRAVYYRARKGDYDERLDR